MLDKILFSIVISLSLLTGILVTTAANAQFSNGSPQVTMTPSPEPTISATPSATPMPTGSPSETPTPLGDDPTNPKPTKPTPMP
jgi:hypothetical protein